MLLKPPAYDGIRHYLFLIPFIIALSCDILNIYFDRFNLKNTLIDLDNISIVSSDNGGITLNL